MPYFNVPEYFKGIRTGFDKIIRKLKNQTSSLSFTNMCNTLLAIGKTFESEPIKILWNGFTSICVKRNMRAGLLINLPETLKYWVGV